MSASPNKAKRARRVDHVSRPTMSMSSTNEAETIIDSSGNRWKRRLHSLRLSLTRRRIHSFIESDTAKEQNNPPEYPLGQRQTENTGVADVCFDNRYQSFSSNNRGHTYNGKGSPSNLNCKSKDVTVLDHLTASSNRASVKERKGLGRHTKDGTLCDNKNRDTSQRNMPNDENKSVGRLGKPHNDGNRRRNRFGRKNAKNMLAFPSWFRSLGRSSAAKNSKHISRDLSLSAGNFNEEEQNFKLLTDVQLLRDPGYVSSSGDSLDRENEDFHGSKYQSLRRSRASLIDIRWHKHGHSEGNLASPKDTISRNKSPLLKTSCKSPSSPNVTAFQSPDLGSLERKLLFCNNNCDNGAGISKRDPSKRRQRRRENKPCSPKCPRITDSEQDISPGNTSKNCNRTPNKPEKDCFPDESRFEQNRQERSCHKSKSCSKHTEVEDVYLTADEDTNEQGEFKLCEESEHTHVKLTKKASPVNSREKRLPDSVSHEMVLHLSNHNSSRKERSVSWVNLPVAVLTDVNGNLKQLDKLEEPHILHMKQSENTVNNLQPCLSKVPKNLSKSQPLKTLPCSQNEVLDTYLNADVTTSVSALDKNNATIWKGATDMCQNCQAETGGVGVRGVQWNLCKFPSGHLNDNHDHQTPYMYCQRCKSSTRGQSRTDMYHDLVFIRPPKKPAPKPPSLIRNRCQSLTTLSGESPVLSEQLSLNETSSVHKLNDSCGENLYELMSQSKGKSQTSEGVYVGISGDQGVILRKKRVLPNPRAVSMPVELLGHVIKEAQGTETPNLSSTDGSISELSNEHASPSLSSGSDVYLSCNSNSPSPVVTNSKEKECCTRLLSISSIEVHELSVQKKANSQSVPCLVLKKDCVDSLKSIQGDHSMKRNFALSSENCFVEGHTDCYSNSSRPQSMISLNHREISNGDGDTNEKVMNTYLLHACTVYSMYSGCR